MFSSDFVTTYNFLSDNEEVMLSFLNFPSLLAWNSSLVLDLVRFKIAEPSAFFFNFSLDLLIGIFF